MTLLDVAAAIMLMVALFRGGRTLWRMRERYQSVVVTVNGDSPEERRSRLLRLPYRIVAVIFVVTAWFGFLSARRLMGLDSFDWAPIINTVIASAVLIGIPEYAERELAQIEEGNP